MFVSSYACSPETAAYDFKYTLDHCRENSPNKAYHLIQAFAPGEVGFEEAHRIGKELADKLLEGKYSYIVTTHIDKGHVHNHIIFCAADNIEHNKYHDCKQSYYHIRKLSDELFYPQLGVKLCSMAGGGVQKIYMVLLREPSRRDRSGSDLFHLRDGFEIKMNFDRNVSCFIFVNALMHDDFFD